MNRPAPDASVTAVIFDMDGVLIDTEPTWRRVEIEVYRGLGCEVTDADMIETMGVPILDVVKQWHRRFPWATPSVEQVANGIVDTMVEEITSHGEPMEGVHAAMTAVRDAGLRIAIASSSSLRMIDAVVRRLKLVDFIDVSCSADDEKVGKPDPAVFLRAAERLHTDPAECLVIEDSPNGIRAALAAGMTCIAIPDQHSAAHEVMATAHARLDSLAQVTPEWLESFTAARS